MSKLSITDLQVESFVTEGEPRGRGTVRAHDVDTIETCMEAECGGTSQPYVTCRLTCPNTCQASCPAVNTCNAEACPTGSGWTCVWPCS